jgi:hypothetical protein
MQIKVMMRPTPAALPFFRLVRVILRLAGFSPSCCTPMIAT